MADDAHDALARALAGIAARLGEDALQDRRRIVALLADALPEHARQTRLLGIAIDNGAVRALSRARLDQVEMEIDRYAQRVDNDLGVRKAIMVPVLRAVAHAVGRGALPSFYAAAEPVAPPPTPQAPAEPDGASWVGLTSPSAAAVPEPVAPPAAAPPPLATPAPAPQPAPIASTPPPPAPPPAPAPAPAPGTAQPSPSPAAASPAVARWDGGLLLWPWAMAAASVWLGFLALRLGRPVADCVDRLVGGDARTNILVLAALLIAFTVATPICLSLHLRRQKAARQANLLWLAGFAGLHLFAIAALQGCGDSGLELTIEQVVTPLTPAAVFAAYFAFSRDVRETYVR